MDVFKGIKIFFDNDIKIQKFRVKIVEFCQSWVCEQVFELQVKERVVEFNGRK